MTDVSQPLLQAEWRVVLNDGSNAVKIIPIPQAGLLMGRAITTDLHLDDPRVSRHHARLTRQGDQLLIEDLQTVNGTLLNGQPLNQATALQPNDVIGLGPFTLKIEQSLVPITPTAQEIHAYPQPKLSLVKPALFLAVAVGGLILIALLCWGLYGYWSARQTMTIVTSAGPTLTVRQAPVDNSTVVVNQPITVQAMAADTAGVTRVELWANGHKVDEVDTQLVEVAPTLNAALQWQPDQPGPLALEVRAYNSTGQMNTQPIANLTVTGQSDAPTRDPAAQRDSPALATANPTVAPLLPTATPMPTALPVSSPTSPPSPSPVPATATPGKALLTLSVPALNVRAGPGTQYPQIGQLAQGVPAEIIGQSSGGQGEWWQIRFAGGPDGTGWVSADSVFGVASSTTAVPVVEVPTPQAAATVPPTITPTLTLSATATTPPVQVIRAPAGKTLLIASNRSMANQPALLTLSDGKSVGGGQTVEVPADSEVQLVLEPDFYRATWSSPGPKGGFANGADFDAPEDKVIVMWVIPDEGRSAIEVYDELKSAAPTPTPTPAPTGTTTPLPISGSYRAPEGKAIFVAANRTLYNFPAVLTLTGGNLGGGQEIKLDAGVEISLELLPGSYQAVWSSPAGQKGFSVGREFDVSAGEVILSWIIPDQRQIFMQFPGQEPQQINK